jgi:RHS repeat-associated protein
LCFSIRGVLFPCQDTLASGASAIVARHDYLPFGEEIWAGIGLRTTTQKYSVSDKVRQRFAVMERDEATGLDHTWFRKYDSFAGRWTSLDALSGSLADPQSFNHYTYAGNDPVNLVDPTGLTEEEWRRFNCTTRADLGIGVLDWAFGWQGPCDGGGPMGGDGPGGGGPRGGGPDRPRPAPKRTKIKTALSQFHSMEIRL